MSKNPFGEKAPTGPQRVNPFGEVAVSGTLEEAVGRIEHSARAVRRLKTQLGAEGLTLSATRELIDELSIGLDAAARALRKLAEKDE